MNKIVMCLPVVLCAHVLANPVDDAKRAISRQYGAISKAFVRNDTEAFKGFMTDDYEATGPKDVKLTRDQVVTDFTVQRKRLSDVRWTKTIKTFDLSGDTAKVLADGKMTARIDFGDKKRHSFQLKASSEDEWVRIASVWKLQRSKTLSFQVEIDGKAVPGS